MHKLLVLLSLFLLSPQASAETTLPDLLFMTGSHFGGFGRLVYSSGRYNVWDGRIYTYVVDGSSIRLMRPDESGGSMGNPAKVVGLDGKIFGNSAYNAIQKFDPATGKIMDRFSYGSFSFSGGYQSVFFASKKNLLLLDGTKMIVLDSEFKKISEKVFDPKVRHVRVSPEYIQENDRLYAIEYDNPNTYTDCAGPGCNFPTVIRQTTVDFSNPAAIQISDHVETVKKQDYVAHSAVDGKLQGWLLIPSGFGEKPKSVSWHPFDHLASPTASTSLPEQSEVLALTKTAPFWMVLKTKEGPRLAQIEVKGDAKKPELVLKLDAYLSWIKGSTYRVALQSVENGKLFLASDHQLAVYDVTGASASLLLQQNFLNANGSGQFQIESLTPIYGLSNTELQTDRDRLERTLKKDYWDDRDHLAIQSEIEKLRSTDTWAISTFRNLLTQRNKSYNGGIKYAALALGKFGEKSVSAIPALVYSTMEGSAIRGDALSIVKSVIGKIDPEGKAIRAMLPECIKKTYVCEHVGKTLLEGMPK